LRKITFFTGVVRWIHFGENTCYIPVSWGQQDQEWEHEGVDEKQQGNHVQGAVHVRQDQCWEQEVASNQGHVLECEFMQVIFLGSGSIARAMGKERELDEPNEVKSCRASSTACAGVSSIESM
jgi:hypothetical protein